jgi:hypothetical protein
VRTVLTNGEKPSADHMRIFFAVCFCSSYVIGVCTHRRRINIQLPSRPLAPINGIDHILAMVAVGIFAANLGGRAIRAVPLTFITLMAVGGALGISGVPVPSVELGIAFSIIGLGLAIAVQWSPSRSRHALSWAPLTRPRGQAGEVRRAQGRFGAGGASAPASGFELCGSSRGDATRSFTPSPRLQPHPVFAYLPARTSI